MPLHPHPLVPSPFILSSLIIPAEHWVSTKITFSSTNSITKDNLLCTLPGRRPGTAKGGERARPGRVLVFFVHFSPSKVRRIKLHIHVNTGLLLLLHMITTNVYFD